MYFQAMFPTIWTVKNLDAPPEVINVQERPSFLSIIVTQIFNNFVYALSAIL